MEAKQKTRLKKFLKDNNITFSGTGSALNSDCVVFAGFSLFVTNAEYSLEEMYPFIESIPGHNKDYQSEFNRVYDFAFYNNYQDWWDKEEAKKKFKF
jgi:hypothetical protein